MVERYDLKTPRKGRDGKTYWNKVGVAFPKKSGDGFNLTLEAIPLPTQNDRGEIEVFISMLPPFDDSKQPRQNPEPNAPLDDDVPF